MANKFSTLADKALAGSEIMKGRTKISTDDVITRFPNGVTLIAVDVIPNDKGGYPVFNIKEDPSIYFNGGAMAMKIVMEWLKEYDGDVDACSRALGSEGGCRVRFYKKQSKNGRTVVMPEVLSD